MEYLLFDADRYFEAWKKQGVRLSILYRGTRQVDALKAIMYDGEMDVARKSPQELMDIGNRKRSMTKLFRFSSNGTSSKYNEDYPTWIVDVLSEVCC